jgi:hypothetical protein
MHPYIGFLFMIIFIREQSQFINPNLPNQKYQMYKVHQSITWQNL